MYKNTEKKISNFNTFNRSYIHTVKSIQVNI